MEGNRLYELLRQNELAEPTPKGLSIAVKAALVVVVLVAHLSIDALPPVESTACLKDNPPISRDLAQTQQATSR